MNSRIAVDNYNISIKLLTQKAELHVVVHNYRRVKSQLNNFSVALLDIVH